MISKYAGMNADFSFTVTDKLGVAVNLSTALLSFVVCKVGETINAIERVPTYLLNVVTDSLTPKETETLGEGIYIVEFKVNVDGKVQTSQSKLQIYKSYKKGLYV